MVVLMYKSGDTIPELGSCEVLRFLSSKGEKQIYEVVWQGHPAILKIDAWSPTPVEHPLWASYLSSPQPLQQGVGVLQEKIVGSTLSTVLRFGNPTLEQRLAWTVQVAEFLEAAQLQGVSARIDVSNVMVVESHGLRVVSLGVDERDPLVCFGLFLQQALPDSAPVAWLASRCVNGNFETFSQVGVLLNELGMDEEIPAEVRTAIRTSSPPYGKTLAAGLLAVMTLLLVLWPTTPVRREPAVYLARGSSVLVIAEASGRSLGTVELDDEVTAITSAPDGNRLYLAMRNSPFIEVLEGERHDGMARYTVPSGASELLLSGRYLVAAYPQLAMVVIVDTETSAARPLSTGEGSLSLAAHQGTLAVAVGRRLDLYRLAPFAWSESRSLPWPIASLWSQEGGIGLAGQGRTGFLDLKTGSLGPGRPRRDGDTSTSLGTPSGPWTIKSGHLLGPTIAGAAVPSWPAPAGSRLAYLGASHAP